MIMAFLTAVSALDVSIQAPIRLTSQEVPSFGNPPPGCRFHPRCRLVDQECSSTTQPVLLYSCTPELLNKGGGEVACFK